MVLFLIPAKSFCQSTQAPKSSPLLEHPEWFKCQSDSDCTIVTGGGWCEGVNKIYSEEFNKLLVEKYSILPQQEKCGKTFECYKNVCEATSSMRPKVGNGVS